MNHLFYFIAFLAILWEVRVLRNLPDFLALHKRNKGKKHISEMEDKYVGLMALTWLYVFWILVGLIFSSQWIVFGIILLLSFLLPKKYKILKQINSVLTICLLLFACINAYHLKINLYQLIVNHLF